MGIIQESKAVFSSQPEKKEEVTIDAVRTETKETPVVSEKVEETVSENVEAPVAEEPAAPVESQPKRKGGRPKKNAKK